MVHLTQGLQKEIVLVDTLGIYYDFRLPKSERLKGNLYASGGYDGQNWKLPPGQWTLIGLCSEVGEEQWKEILPTISGWKTPLYYNYMASGRDYRDIIESAFDNASESSLTFLKSHSLKPETTILLIKK